MISYGILFISIIAKDILFAKSFNSHNHVIFNRLTVFLYFSHRTLSLEAIWNGRIQSLKFLITQEYQEERRQEYRDCTKRGPTRKVHQEKMVIIRQIWAPFHYEISNENLAFYGGGSQLSIIDFLIPVLVLQGAWCKNRGTILQLSNSTAASPKWDIRLWRFWHLQTLSRLIRTRRKRWSPLTLNLPSIKTQYLV